MSNQKPVALLPCPLCGGDALRNGRAGIAGGVRCGGRNHFVQVYGRTQDEADAAWNRRAGDDQ